MESTENSKGALKHVYNIKLFSSEMFFPKVVIGQVLRHLNLPGFLPLMILDVKKVLLTLISPLQIHQQICMSVSLSLSSNYQHTLPPETLLNFLWSFYS